MIKTLQEKKTKKAEKRRLVYQREKDMRDTAAALGPVARNH
ncbi:hypothetical protein [Salinivibrio sp. SS3]|nr:hypothetical protein [Salinivibrio sp. BNH]